MISLAAFRDHCRRMAGSEHLPDCRSITAREPYWAPWRVAPDGMSMTWRGPKPKWEPPTCDGCISETDRALFARLAGEVDEYLTGPDATLPLG